jgi:hypothetical protein
MQFYVLLHWKDHFKSNFFSVYNFRILFSQMFFFNFIATSYQNLTVPCLYSSTATKQYLYVKLMYYSHIIRCRVQVQLRLHCKKKVREFPAPSRDVTTKLSLGGNNDVITELFLPRGSLVSDIPAGDGKLVNLFLQCNDVCDIQVFN